VSLSWTVDEWLRLLQGIVPLILTVLSGLGTLWLLIRSGQNAVKLNQVVEKVETVHKATNSLADKAEAAAYMRGQEAGRIQVQLPQDSAEALLARVAEVARALKALEAQVSREKARSEEGKP
jgi:hypothetical protein